MRDDSRGHSDENHPLDVPSEEMCEQKDHSEQKNGEWILVKRRNRSRKDQGAHESGLSV